MANLSYMSGTHINSNSRIAAVTCTTTSMKFHWVKFTWFHKLVNFCKSEATMRVNLNKLDIIDIRNFITNLAIW